MDISLLGVIFISAICFFVVGKVFETKVFILAAAIWLLLLGFATMNDGVSFALPANSTVSQTTNNNYSTIYSNVTNGSIYLLANSSVSQSRNYTFQNVVLTQDFRVSLGITFVLLGLFVFLSVILSSWSDFTQGKKPKGW